MFVDHLKNLDVRNLFRVVAYGEHIVNGLCKASNVTGAAPNHQITVQQILGKDEWAGVSRGIYWNDILIPPSAWKFYPGKISTGNDDPIQGVDSVFTNDVPHSGTPWIRFALEQGVGEADTTKTPPIGFQGYFKTKLVNDYDATGAVIGYSWSANPARIIADLILVQGKRSPSLIDWGAWVAFRDFCAELIAYDYRLLPNFDGFGLTATYYSGTNFDTFHSKRIDNLIAFFSPDGAPGYDLNPAAFSARFEGYIKLPFNEQYTYYLTHNDGVRFKLNGNTLINEWRDDGFGPVGTHSATHAFGSAGFVPVEIEWNNGNLSGEIKLEWESASQPREVIPSKYLYPKTEMRSRYEIHPYFETRTRLDEAVRTCLRICNSTYQKVNGKYRFFCLEQLSQSSFDFNEDNIISISVKPRDKISIRNRFSAGMRDIDSRFIKPPARAIIVERPDLQALAGRPIDGDDLQFFNCTQHQAHRLLSSIAARECDALPLELVGNASTFPVLGGDRVRISTEIFGWANKHLLVTQSNDASSEETADERNFNLQEWTN